MPEITNTTKIKRGQLLSALDEFCTFYWGGESAWDKFGVFIINDQKGSLKFYNGPGFSNEYTKPQFDSAGGSLQGVNFNKQTINFKIGVYWISIEDYRKLMNWLNPMKIDYLVFGFDLMYRYDVKLSKIGDSTRWIIGRENGEPRYYTELDLTFEIQGAPCAKGTHPYEFNKAQSSTNKARIQTHQLKTKTDQNQPLSEFIASDLETPVKVTFEIKPSEDSIDNKCYFETNGNFNTLVLAEEEFGWDNDNTLILDPRYAVFDNDALSLYSTLDYLPIKYLVSLDAKYIDSSSTESKEQTFNLLTTTLQNLTLFTKTGENQQNEYESTSEQEAVSLTFTYNSETGLVFLKTSDDIPSLLTLSTYADTNDFLVESLSVNKFMLPGNFQYEGFYNGTVQFILSVQKQRYEIDEWVSYAPQESVIGDVHIECFPRTNII